MTGRPKPHAYFSPLGENAILVQSDGPMSIEAQRFYWAFEHLCQDHPAVEETVLGVHSLLVRYSTGKQYSDFLGDLQKIWSDVAPSAPRQKSHEIPVTYGGEFGLDLVDLAAEKNMTPKDLIARHSAAEYTVFSVGSMPGFTYLGGLPKSLATPRRSVPRLSVKQGSVGIGGEQAGVISRTSPSGWNLIGHTEFNFFDPSSNTPAPCAPGDRLRFVPIKVEI